LLGEVDERDVELETCRSVAPIKHLSQVVCAADVAVCLDLPVFLDPVPREHDVQTFPQVVVGFRVDPVELGKLDARLPVRGVSACSVEDDGAFAHLGHL